MFNNSVLSAKDKRSVNIVFALSAIIILFATIANKLPSGMIGAVGVMAVVGYILNLVGNKTPIVNQYFGGGAIVVIFGSSYLFHSGLVPQDTVANVTTFMKSGGFLSFFIASLVTGSVLGMDSNVLKKAALKYIPVILGGVACAFLFAGIVGAMLGRGFFDSVMLIALPIMGGGMGAGAVPLVEIMSGRTSMSSDELMSIMVPALAIGNAIAIVTAGLLNKLGNAYPSLTGNGQLIRGEENKEEEDLEEEMPLTVNTLGVGALLAIVMFLIGTLLHMFIDMHPYALMIISVAVIKVTGFVPRQLERAAHVWSKFVLDNLTPALLVGIGVVYTNLDQIVAALTVSNILMVFSTVLGAVFGSAVIGRLMGFYPIEAAITGGLCMANMGGTGDVAVLASCKRMDLMPFAQISSRLGGALMLILATFILQLFL
ncbi:MULTISPECIES: 2-hydroxycarboxylate transporter family protein [Vibrio]|uniref:Citrate:sodium symporter n=2 Tax=Vibrio TaxID=662 RepID=A0A7X4LMK0_9VIBR|nr:MULTISPECIES: 2-hydroxycarboxylate transporter family protein [Vibrio]MBF9003031.1 2-hydroxycarboxylate transporter family protein [Vibrio nitrifigilis]MZI94526.1 citrate:sodium symporter [Vibrio eleionomae]